MVHLRDKVIIEHLIGNYTQCIEWYHFQWPWLALDWDFKIVIFFDIEYIRNDRDIVTIEHQLEVVGSVSNGDIFNDIEDPNPVFNSLP